MPKFRDLSTSAKTPLGDKNTNVVYSIPCKCDKFAYIGETERKWGTRKREHQDKVRLTKEDIKDGNITRATARMKDRDGNTSLMICLKAKKLMLFELIVNSPRVDVTIEDNDGNSVLSFALRYKMDEYAERLFAKMQNEPPPSTQETGNQGKLDCQKLKLKEECPVCLEVFTSKIRVYQCLKGHFTCESCKDQMDKGRLKIFLMTGEPF